MGTEKHLLYIDIEEARPEVVDALACQGWLIDHADDPGQASACLREHAYKVGLIPLVSDNLFRKSGSETLFNESRTEWVALVDQAVLKNDDIRHFLKTLFYAYHILPGDAQQLDSILRHAAAMAELVMQDGQYTSISQNDDYEMVGTTPVMHKLFNTIRKATTVDAPVLITGESGTGKELTARSIHERSIRSKGPFNAVNCAALPDNLIQSELFGHEKGAFTGATHAKIGRIEATAGGTLLLDEIGDLSMDMQVNLLRFLEGHFIQRIGSNKEISVDVRVIAATHVNLEKAVCEGRFREDLYHRLNVLQVRVPSLRDRPEDIEILARFFFQKFIKEKNPYVKDFSQETLTIMRRYAWPGNVRELINRIRRAMVMCESRLIKPADLGLERRSFMRQTMTLEQARDYAEKHAIEAALFRNKHNIQHAAQDLGVSRVHMYRLLEKYKRMMAETNSRNTSTDSGPPGYYQGHQRFDNGTKAE